MVFDGFIFWIDREVRYGKIFYNEFENQTSQTFKGYHYSIVRTKGKTFNFDGKEWKWKDKCD